MPVYRRDPTAPPPMVNRRVSSSNPSERRVYGEATATSAPPRVYAPATPRRVFQEETLDPFTTTARMASAMSDAYSAMADNGVIPNQLRGYIGRDDMVNTRNTLAKYLNRSTGGNPYVAKFASQTPYGLDAGGAVGYLGDDVYRDILSRFGAQEDDNLTGLRAARIDSLRDLDRPYNSELPQQNLGFIDYKDYRKDNPYEEFTRRWPQMTYEQKRRWSNRVFGNRLFANKKSVEEEE